MARKKEREDWPLTRRVEVRWDDAGSSGGWRSREETAKSEPLKCRSIGYLVTRTKNKIILAASMSASNGDVGDRIIIPASCVLSVKRI